MGCAAAPILAVRVRFLTAVLGATAALPNTIPVPAGAAVPVTGTFGMVVDIKSNTDDVLVAGAADEVWRCSPGVTSFAVEGILFKKSNDDEGGIS